MDKDKKVIIEWIDSRQIHGWVLEEDIEDTCCNISSCGFLVKETDEAYIVALSKGYNPLQWCGINIVPKCSVVSIEEIVDRNN